MAVDDEQLLRILTEFLDALGNHRRKLADRVAEMERSYTVLSDAVAGRSAEEFLQRSRRSRDAFVVYDDAVKDITLLLKERVEALRGA